MTLPDRRQYAPATQRNRDFILSVLQAVLPPMGTVLEVSSGTGEHAIFFAPQLAPRRWLPSDPNPIARDSIAAWQMEVPSDNLYPPIALDAALTPWSIEQRPLPDELLATDFDPSQITAIVNINMIHISPWSACLGLLAGAGRLLPVDGILYLYGPYKQNGQHTAPSNEQFDLSLRSQNPEWGVRNLEDVIEAAAPHGLKLVKIAQMPANNLSVVLEKEK